MFILGQPKLIVGEKYLYFFGRGQYPFGIIRKFVMKIASILSIPELRNLSSQTFYYLVQYKFYRLLATTLSIKINNSFLYASHVVKYHYYTGLVKRTETNFLTCLRSQARFFRATLRRGHKINTGIATSPAQVTQWNLTGCVAGSREKKSRVP